MRRKATALGITLIAFCSLGLVTTTAANIAISLHADRHRYKIGDIINLMIVYKNLSSHPVWLPPQIETSAVDAFAVKPISSKRTVEKIRFGLPSIAWDELSHEVVRLNPQAHIYRRVIAEVRSTLPKDYDDPRKGLFLILPASAVRLPGAGKYEVQAIFHSSADHPVNAYLPAEKKLWVGDVRSDPIVIEIRQ